MQTPLKLGCLLAALWAPCAGFGHGNPVRVNVSGGRLIVSGGLPTPSGFVDLTFDHHEDAELQLAPGFKLGSSLPGFVVNDMELGSGLYLEVIARPDFSDPLVPERWLWFWDKETEQVETAPDDPMLELASEQLFGSVPLKQYDAPATGPSVKIMEPESGDLGVHQHPLLFLLDNAPAARLGAYGFFARLTSPNYAASDPFLIALNHTLSSDEYAHASRAINAAARLPGDYDDDHDVDGADFLLWQRTFGSGSELAADGSLNGLIDGDDVAIWREHYGRRWPAGSSAVGSTPEPQAAVLLLLATAGMTTLGRKRSARTGCRE
jgi:hypothetical protein